MKTADDLKQIKLITPVGKLAFCKNLFKQNDKGRYSVCVIFEKSQAKELANFKELIADWEEVTWGNNKPSDLHSPIKLETRESMIEKYPFMDNMIVLNATNGFAPGVIDIHGKVLESEADVKAGDSVKLSISAYTYNNKVKGVGFNVNGLQLVEKGEALYGHASTADMFGITPATLEEVTEVKKEEFDNYGF